MPDAETARAARDLEFLRFEHLESGRIKIDLRTPLEYLYLLFLAGAVVAVVALVQVVSISKGVALPAGLVVVSLVCVAISAVIHKRTETYYLVDPEKRQLLYHRRFLGHESRRPAASFDHVAGVAVDGSRVRVKNNRSFWVYWIVLILEDGSTIRLTDSEEGRLYTLNLDAKRLADLLGAEFWAGRLEQKMTVRRDPATGEFYFSDRSGAARPLARQARGQACSFCEVEGEDADPLQTCGGCKAAYHADCQSELGGCETQGCGLESANWKTTDEKSRVARRAVLAKVHRRRAERDRQRASRVHTSPAMPRRDYDKRLPSEDWFSWLARVNYGERYNRLHRLLIINVSLAVPTFILGAVGLAWSGTHGGRAHGHELQFFGYGLGVFFVWLTAHYALYLLANRDA